MKETGLTGKRRSTTIAATPDDGNSQRKRRRRMLPRSYTLLIYWDMSVYNVMNSLNEDYRMFARN